MKASQRILSEGAVYGPPALNTMTRAFDAAWLQIHNRMDVRLQPEAFRLRLADAILREARNGASDIEELKAAAFRRLGFSIIELVE